MENLQTIRDWLRWAVSRFNDSGLFFGHGCDNAFDEAAWIILNTLHLPPDRLDTFLDARLTERERQSVSNILQQRISRRIPAAYLMHEAWLGDFRFYVDERVIVPRSYFSTLLAEQLTPWVLDPDGIQSALDLCTGSGCLAILMAHAFPNAAIDAADLSLDALSVARRNVVDYGLDQRITLIASDVFSGLQERRYDLIISNPPYVTKEAMADIPAEYRHEPRMALESGCDGLDVVRRILTEAGSHLNPDGQLLVEVGHNAGLVEQAYPGLPFTWIDTLGGEGKIFRFDASELKQYF
jgi:ribosomal protein L3 glutamine methyltransferase